ncbi:tetratricopeptide repeat protein [bacterium]|nr:tetratricopeptide repeat protein [bacterium]
MPIRRLSKTFIKVAILFGGFLFCKTPLLGQYTIDLTDGICSQRFLNSAENVAKSYANDLGAPEFLSQMIDSSFISEDYISTITYLYIAHFAAGVDETYLGDIAFVMERAGCNSLPDSLYKLHMEINPRDYKAIGNYAILLAKNWKFKDARHIIESNLGKFRGEKKNNLLRDLGLVRALEYNRNKSEKALSAAFEAFRKTRYGTRKSPTTLQRGAVDFKVAPVESFESGKYRFNASLEHAVGSDGIILNICGRIVFGREMTTDIKEIDQLDVAELLGDIYIAPGDYLQSERGALEVIGDLGEFAPFYDGRIELEIEVVFPDGSRKYFKNNPEPLTLDSPHLSHITSELFYGKGEWSCSLMTEIADSGADLPVLWRESAYLSTALEDSSKWVEAINFVDSLMNIKLYPNLWVYRGALDYLLGNYVAARHPLLQALENDPNNYWAMHNLGLVEYELGNESLAVELLIKTADINPEMSANYIVAGAILEEDGKLREALKYYKKGHSKSAFRSDEVQSWIKNLEQQPGIMEPIE